MARIFPEIAWIDAKMARLAGKVAGGERLVLDDGLTILRTPDLPGLGRLADWAKRNRTGSPDARQGLSSESGNEIFYTTNTHVNYTNICSQKCEFCKFSKRKGEAGAYEMTFDEIVSRIDAQVREVHLVGALHPDWPFEHYLEMLRAIRQARPGVGIKGFTAVEIAHFADRAGFSVENVLEKLKEAGLTSLPGGGAEIFSPRVRKILCPDKLSGKTWLDVHRTAHRLGIPSNATMLYGHAESLEERVFHLTALRELQDQTNGFLCFVPLPFQEWEQARYRTPDPCDDLRVIALSRLYLDNIPHIKAYWVMLGLETTVMSLCYGADDIDGTVREERIAHAAGATTPQGIDAPMIRAMAKQAGKQAVERDSLYRRIVK